jgi:ubiquinone/menaquinone biosynthesis C-methylase UbiE
VRRPEVIARQSARPTGLLGRLIGFVMSHETVAANKAAVDMLELTSSDRVLEIGFGHGRTIERMAAAPVAFIAGVDTSDEMLRMATGRCQGLIEAGRVSLAHGDSERLPFPSDSFTKVLTVHTLYFWSVPQTHLREIHRVLRPGGRFVLAFRTPDDPASRNFPATVYRFYPADQVAHLLRGAGFVEVALTAAPDGTAIARAIKPA